MKQIAAVCNNQQKQFRVSESHTLKSENFNIESELSFNAENLNKNFMSLLKTTQLVDLQSMHLLYSSVLKNEVFVLNFISDLLL